MEEKGRFAPSNSGRMHLGNLFCALLAWLGARSAGGSFLVRMEDLDTARCRPEYAGQLLQDLLWLGLDWDEGPLRGGTCGPYEQSARTALYREAVERLQMQGLVYPCFCTRAQLHAASAPHGADGLSVYDGRCARLQAEERAALGRTALRPPALRLRVPPETITFTDGLRGTISEFLPEDCGDFLLRRSDGLFAYQLAVVVDDAAMGVTQVVRGADLLSSTPRQLLLYRLLGLAAPKFYHIPLLCAADGRRLSKRDGDLSLGALREHTSPGEILGKLGYLAGVNPGAEPCTPDQLLAAFAWDKVPRTDVRLPAGLFAP